MKGVGRAHRTVAVEDSVKKDGSPEKCDLGKAEVFANQMCCRDASGVLFGLWAYRRMLHSIVAILDINMSRLVDIAHRNILIVGRILAAGAQA